MWLANLPHIWRLNPALSHFITVPETVKLADLAEYARSVFTQEVVATLDDILVMPDSIHRVSPYMRHKGKFSTAAVTTVDVVDLISSVNEESGGLVVPLESGGKAYDVKPESIAVGPGATNRGSSSTALNVIDKTVPSNGTGTLDTWEIWFMTDATAVEFATFVHAGSNVLSTRDYESIGNVSSGSKQTFSGLSTDVVTGDYAGAHYATGTISRENTGLSDLWYISSGDYIPCTSVTFSTYVFRISIYATGTEGGATAKTASDNGAGTDSRLSFLASLARADNGGSSDGTTGRGLVINDSGLGVDIGVIPGLKSLLSDDFGVGGDALKALLGTSGVGSDMKLPGRQGHVTIPSKGVSL